MLSVIVSPPGAGDKNTAAVHNLLKRCCVSAAVGQTFVDIPDGEPDFMLISFDGAKRFSRASNCAVLLFSGGFLPPEAEGSTLLAFEGCSTEGLARGCQLLSCGLHRRDTITLSSLENGRPVLSVQREFFNLRSEKVEVGEYPLLYNGKNHPALIAAAALLLLCGKPLPPDAFQNF